MVPEGTKHTHKKKKKRWLRFLSDSLITPNFSGSKDFFFRWIGIMKSHTAIICQDRPSRLCQFQSRFLDSTTTAKAYQKSMTNHSVFPFIKNPFCFIWPCTSTSFAWIIRFIIKGKKKKKKNSLRKWISEIARLAQWGWYFLNLSICHSSSFTTQGQNVSFGLPYHW